jgi:hypothetical protein
MTDEHEQSERPEPAEDWRDGATGRFLPAPSGKGGVTYRGGRKKGALNRTTVQMRHAISAVFQDLQEGHAGRGEYPHFLDWAKENPTDFYRIAARQLPLQVETTSQAIGLVVFKGLND